MSIHVLKGYKAIFEVFCELKDSFFSFDGNLGEYILKLSKNAEVYACYIEDKPVGVVAFYANDVSVKTAFLTSILVNRDLKGRGIGSALLTAAENECFRRGFKEIRLEVHCENLAAIRFYKNRNYRFLRKSSDDSVYMVKNL